MPYTPPSHSRPAFSVFNSPSSTHTEVQDQSASATSRPISSTSYLQKHRRSPSSSQCNDELAENTRANMNGLISLPLTESPDSSDDGIDGGNNMTPEPVNPFRSLVGPEFSPSVKKNTIHSRSASDSALDISDDTAFGSDSEEEEWSRTKTPLIRKKSGELVRPALRAPLRRRPASAPGTPTYAKAVHFNEDIEQVRHFLQIDRPIAVSAGSSPAETFDTEGEYPFMRSEEIDTLGFNWTIRLPNFPTDSLQNNSMPVRLEKLMLSSDSKTLLGKVSVENLAFEKLVVARFTLDFWKTTSEVVAEYTPSEESDGRDQFSFNIKLADQAKLETKILILCLRYSVDEHQFWDNNNSMNYTVEFVKHSKENLWERRSMLEESMASISRNRRSASLDDDIVRRLGESSSLKIRLKAKPQEDNSQSEQQSHRSIFNNQSFFSRYDFGSSLSAALSKAQNTIDPRGALRLRTSLPQKPIAPRVAPVAMHSKSAAIASKYARPDILSSEKPDLMSAEYNELIRKFCFFGSSDHLQNVPSNLNKSKCPKTVAPNSCLNDTELSTCTDGTNDMISSPSIPLAVRSVSPRAMSSPNMDFGHLFHQNLHSNIFSESHSRTAIPS